MSAAGAVLMVLAFGFAWSMGAHYTGACMGMPYATGSIRLRPALAMMAALAVLGAIFLSHRVLTTVGHHLIESGRLPLNTASVVVGAAFLLTTLYNRLRIPTSTIQILVFSLIGAGLALHITVQWMSLVRLVVVWLVAPLVAMALGFAFTHLLDWAVIAGERTSAVSRVLVLAGLLASLTMGANDVSNATAVFVTSHLSSLFFAGAFGGAGLALGVLTWGRPLLERVAFEIVRLDLPMATAAQAVQGIVVLSAVLGFGDFTSMNQALVGAMAGAGLARGRETVQWHTLRAILKGWLVGPLSGLALAWGMAFILRQWNLG